MNWIKGIKIWATDRLSKAQIISSDPMVLGLVYVSGRVKYFKKDGLRWYKLGTILPVSDPNNSFLDAVWHEINEKNCLEVDLSVFYG